MTNLERRRVHDYVCNFILQSWKKIAYWQSGRTLPYNKHVTSIYSLGDTDSS
jgi:hypothetical protein